MQMPLLETNRLRVRPLQAADLQDAHQIVVDAGWSEDDAAALEKRREWLDWSVRNEPTLAQLAQPPYGDRAIILKASGECIGLVGLVPAFGPFGQLTYYRQRGIADHRYHLPEFGLFWALKRPHRGQGYATEAARAMIDFAFGTLHLRRIVATTEHDNTASMAVMRRLGMTIDHNPDSTPPWFQVVGILENDILENQKANHLES